MDNNQDRSSFSNLMTPDDNKEDINKEIIDGWIVGSIDRPNE